MDRVVLVDGTSLIYRAFFALPQNLRTAKGLHTNAIYGFALMFRKILAGKLPRYGAVVFDAPGGTFRDELYTEYKAQRPRMPGELAEQLAWIDKVVETHDFPKLSVRGYEADDVIGTLTRQALEAGHEVRIISGDKDFAQLIGERVRMVDTMRDVTFDVEVVRKKWGVRPERFVDYLALLGDKSDNIPGVPGIGKKGAVDLLEQFGDLEAILAGTESLKGRKKATLEENAELARLSYKLATIDQHVPLELGIDDLVLKPVDGPKINTLFKELEFYSLIDAEEGEHDITADGTLTIVSDLNQLRSVLANDSAAVYPVHEQDAPLFGALVGIALAPSPSEAIYVPILGEDGLGQPALDAMEPWLRSAHKTVHDMRSASYGLKRAGLTLDGVVADTALASFLVDPSGLIPHRLDQCSKWYLHKTVPPKKSVVGSGKTEKLLSECATEDVANWAGLLAMRIAELGPLLTERVEAAGQTKQLHDRDMPLADVLGQMQLDGIRVDGEHLLHLQSEFAARKEVVEERIYALAGRTFNIGSTKQLGAILFDELKLPVIKRTKTGYSTNAEVLERLAPKHEIASEVLVQRALAKLINTYTAVLHAAIDPRDGRVHATFQQTVGVSGRLISTDPDLQRTPIRTGDGCRIREAFIPREGWTLISADWSQIELRVMAHISGDPLLKRAFDNDLDLHRQTASYLFEVDEDAVSPDQRNVGKTFNFATIYGQGATALGQQLGIPRKEAVAMIDRYFSRYAGVRSWIDATVAQAHEDGFVETLLGRRRYIPELTSNNWSTRGYGERVAANTPIQGSAADLCKLAMLEIASGLRGMETRMLLQIHDELIFEAPPGEVDAACALIRRCMEHPLDLSVPLKVDIGCGASWAEAH
ncbi:MAG: DNA polymerase I [Proteobacteria bacterium]|nr:DNA polymerase I [Pseudomonadota bacterium]